MNKKQDLRLGCFCALGCETLFGFSYLFTKNASGHAGVLGRHEVHGLERLDGAGGEVA